MKKSMNEMKNAKDSINSRTDQAEDRISGTEDKNEEKE